MPYDDPEEEDWYDDEDEPADEEVARCPECGGPVSIITDKCPSCGYWLLAADRQAMWSSGERKPLWLRVTAWVVLLALVFGLLVAGFTIF
jgi:ribosomal protein S27AE